MSLSHFDPLANLRALRRRLHPPAHRAAGQPALVPRRGYLRNRKRAGPESRPAGCRPEGHRRPRREPDPDHRRRAQVRTARTRARAITASSAATATSSAASPCPTPSIPKDRRRLQERRPDRHACPRRKPPSRGRSKSKSRREASNCGVVHLIMRQAAIRRSGTRDQGRRERFLPDYVLSGETICFDSTNSLKKRRKLCSRPKASPKRTRTRCCSRSTC